MEEIKKYIDVEKIAPPKGGGAYKGLGETCSIKPFQGEAVLTIPLDFTKSRANTPNLEIRYKASDGNSVFGMGFTMNLMTIRRTATDCIPTYSEKDGFLFGDGEKLVKKENQKEADGFRHTYGFQREQTFMRLWHCADNQDNWWEATDKDGVHYLLGKERCARIADASNSQKVFAWMVSEVVDTKGNKVRYHYNEHGNVDVIEYGNFIEKDGNEQWFFKAFFHYEQRQDVFRSYKAGFMQRTEFLCSGISMCHFVDGIYVTVQRTDFIYDKEGLVSLLAEVRKTGYQKKDNKIISETLPLLKLNYVPFKPDKSSFHVLETRDVRPSLMVDLYGEGAAGILYSTKESVMYSRPLGNYKFGEPQSVTEFPIYREPDQNIYRLKSLNADGKCDLAVYSEGINGYFRMDNYKWNGFTPFEASANELSKWKEYADMEGDRRSHLVITHKGSLRYYPNRGEKGVDTARTEVLPEDFPHISQDSVEEKVTFVDMWGDGLSHRVRVKNGSVECWPNLGYGRFGEKVTLYHAPYYKEGMDMSRLLLADIDGSGTTDIVYLFSDHADIYFNKGGEGFLNPVRVQLPKQYAMGDQITFADINGTGTLCMVCCQTGKGAKGWCLDFSNNTKPYLLERTQNVCGGTNKLIYKSSASLYLEGLQKGDKWKICPPFPIQVLVRREHTTAFTKDCEVTTYHYKDGLYDCEERKFYGFGMVEVKEEADRDAAREGSIKKYWYYVGLCYQEEFGTKKKGLEPSAIESADMEKAWKILYGEEIRQEICAWDCVVPKKVYESNYTVKELFTDEMSGMTSYSVFLYETLEMITEEALDDPRIQQELFADRDAYGNVLKKYVVYYGRNQRDNDAECGFDDLWQHQNRMMVKTEEYAYANIEGELFRSGIIVEEKKYESILPAMPEIMSLRRMEELLEGIGNQLCFWKKYFYYDGKAEREMPFGNAGICALIHHCEWAVWPENSELFDGAEEAKDLMMVVCTEIDHGFWWQSSSTVHYGRQETYFEPSFEEEQRTGYKLELFYDKYCLKPIRILQYETAESSCETVLELDQYTCEYKSQIDCNEIITSASFHPLGSVSACVKKGFCGDCEEEFSTAFTYDYQAFWQDQIPIHMEMSAIHRRAKEEAEPERCQVTYWDENSNELEVKYRSREDNWLVSTKNIYNSMGSKIKEYSGYYTDTSAFLTPPCEMLPTNTYYDYDGRVVRRESPFTSQDKTNGIYAFEEIVYHAWHRGEYDRNQGHTKDAGHKARVMKVMAFDPVGREFAHITVEEVEDGMPLVTLEEVFLYSVYGLLEKASDGRLLANKVFVISCTYDLLGRRIREESADAGSMDCLYDCIGNLVYTRDAKGTKTEYRYDGMNRHIVTKILGLGITEKIVYGSNYWENSKYNLVGQVTRHYDQAGVEENKQYSVMGLVEQQARTYISDYKAIPDWAKDNLLEEQTYKHWYQYDSSGNVTEHEMPDGSKYAFQFDCGGQLYRVIRREDTETDVVKQITYQSEGKRKSILYGNGVKVTYEYDAFTQNITGVKTVDSMGNVLQYFKYTFDYEGNLLKISDMIGKKMFREGKVVSPEWEYEYDTSYHLIRASGREMSGHSSDYEDMCPYVELYSYDGSGNLTDIKHKGTASRSFNKHIVMDSFSNRTTKVKVDGTRGQVYPSIYDACGNVCQSSARGSYVWNPKNQIEKVVFINRENGADAEYYIYNYQGIRERKITIRRDARQMGIVTDTIFSGGYRVERRYTKEESEERSCVELFDKDGVLAEIYSLNEREGIQGCEAIYPIETYTNAASLETGTDGAIVAIEEYYPYGGTAVLRQGSGRAVRRFRRYAGKEYDEATGLYYYKSRYYNCCEGRMMSPDDSKYIKEKWHSQNRYMFSGGNPTSYRDPEGHEKEWILVAVLVLTVLLMIICGGGRCCHAGDSQYRCLQEVISGGRKLTRNMEKGNFAELLVARDQEKKGRRILNSKDVPHSLADKPHQGIDLVVRDHKGKTDVIEVKYNTSQLGKTKDGDQMSKRWIANRLPAAVGTTEADYITVHGYDRILARVSTENKITYRKL